jgi:hypothetical protein
MLCVGLGASAAVVAAGIFCLFLDECIGFSMLNEVVVVVAVVAFGAVDVVDVDAVDAADDALEVDVLVEAAVDAWVGESRSSLNDGVDDIILM